MTAPGLLVSVYDGTYSRVGQVPRYISCSLTWTNLGVGAGTLVVGEDDPITPYLLGADRGVVPVVAQYGRVRWSGRVSQALLEREGPVGSGTVTATLVDDWVWLQNMLASQGGASASLTGMPEYDRRTGRVATLAANFVNDSATRLGVPVKAVVPQADTSPTVTLNARMTTLADLLTDPLDVAGATMQARIWLPGDDQPIAGTTLTSATVVFYPQMPTAKPWLQWTDSMANLNKITLAANQPTGYRAIVGLNGQEAARVYDQYTDTARKAQGAFGLPEIYVDASDIDAAGAEAQAKAVSELAATVGTVAAGFEVADADPWVFGTDYFVGDLATIYTAGVTWQQTVSKVTATDDRDNGLVLAPVIGSDPPVTDGSDMMVAALGRVAGSLRTLQARR